jgi:hypothetical protein
MSAATPAGSATGCRIPAPCHRAGTGRGLAATGTAERAVLNRLRPDAPPGDPVPSAGTTHAVRTPIRHDTSDAEGDRDQAGETGGVAYGRGVRRFIVEQRSANVWWKVE